MNAATASRKQPFLALSPTAIMGSIPITRPVRLLRQGRSHSARIGSRTRVIRPILAPASVLHIT
jgi:hypothetical protein